MTTPIRFLDAIGRLSRCAARTVHLAVRGSLHRTSSTVGRRVTFGDDSTAKIYRHTVVDGMQAANPVVLIVKFRLRRVRTRFWHGVFRAESLLNTPLFAGFPGFLSKLWLEADEYGRYRGIYRWDGAESAREYVRTLWWPLLVVASRSSVEFEVRPVDFFEMSDDVPVVKEAQSWWEPASV